MSVKNGPRRVPFATTKMLRAATGQSLLWVRPTIISAPFPNRSHFAIFKWILTIVGAAGLSIATSPHVSDVAGLIEAVCSQVATHPA